MPFFLVAEERSPKVLSNRYVHLPTQTRQAEKIATGFPRNCLCWSTFAEKHLVFQKILLSTGDAYIKASPYDKYCGIGFDISDPNSWRHLDAGMWGKNDFGMALTYVRDQYNAYYTRKGYTDGDIK